MMIERKIVKILSENNIIAEEDSSLYIFGFGYLLGFITNIVTAVIIGAILGMIWECILFLVAYIPLRQYAGGYHAANSRSCYVLSIILIIIALIIIRYMNVNLPIINILLILSCITIFIKAPVESQNKPLNDEEKKQFRRIACMIVILETFTSLILFWATFNIASKCILVAVLMVTGTLFSFKK